MSNSAFSGDGSSRREPGRGALVGIAETFVPAAGVHPDRLVCAANVPSRSFHDALRMAASWGFELDPRSFRRAYDEGRIGPESLRWALSRSIFAAGGLDRPLLGPRLTVGRALEIALSFDVDARPLLEEEIASASAELGSGLVEACVGRVLCLGPSTPSAPATHDLLPPAQRGIELARVLRIAGLDARELDGVSTADLRNLFSLLDRFDRLSRAEIWQVAFDRSRLPDAGHGGARRSSPVDTTRPLAPTSMRDAVAIGASFVVIGRTPPYRPLDGEALVFVHYDATADADGSELRSITRAIPSVVRSGFERYLRRLGCGSDDLRAALAREMLGEEALAFDPLDPNALAKECPEAEPVPGRTVLLIEASSERIGALLAHDGRLRDLHLLSWLMIAATEATP